MVERSLSMREAPGSIPGLSIQSLSVRWAWLFVPLKQDLRSRKFKILFKID